MPRCDTWNEGTAVGKKGVVKAVLDAIRVGGNLRGFCHSAVTNWASNQAVSSGLLG